MTDTTIHRDVIAKCGADGYWLFPLEDDEGQPGYSFKCNCGYESPSWYEYTADAKYDIQIHQSGGDPEMPDNDTNGQPETVPTTTSVPTTTNVDDE